MSNIKNKLTKEDKEFSIILGDMIKRRMENTGESRREATTEVLEYLESLPFRAMKELNQDED